MPHRSDEIEMHVETRRYQSYSGNKTEEIVPDCTTNSKRQLYLAYLIVGLLCVLQALLNITLRVSWNESRDPTETSFPNQTLTGQNEELQSALDNMVEERNNLQSEIDNMVEERNNLQSALDNMGEEIFHVHRFSDNMFEEKNHLQGTHCKCWQNNICSCYYMSHSMKNWNDSRNDCRERGSDLIVVNSEEEQEDFVPEGFWLGLTDAEEEGTWKWVDGTPLTTADWGRSEPNNEGIAPNKEEDCAEHKLMDSWNDVSCLADRYWICEKNLDVSALSDLHD